MRNFRRRKHPRLRNKSIYSIPGTVVHVIIGTHRKQAHFSDPLYAMGLCKIILSVAKEFENRVHAYCVMPDHLHILVEASQKMGVIEFVKTVKGRFYSWCKRRGIELRLQKSFYDHVLRRDEDVRTVARYILGNPVRAGISIKIGEYPFAGSTEFSL